MEEAEHGRDDRVLVYENPAETGVRMTTIFAISTLLFSLFLAIFVFNNMAGRPGEGPLAPIGRRLAWASAIATVGVAFFLTMWRHLRHVTARLWYRPHGDLIEVENMGLFKTTTRPIDLRDLRAADFHPGDQRGEERANVPYVRLASKGGTFIVNLPGEVYRTDIFARVLDAAGFDPDMARRRQAEVDEPR